MGLEEVNEPKGSKWAKDAQEKEKKKKDTGAHK